MSEGCWFKNQAALFFIAMKTIQSERLNALTKGLSSDADVAPNEVKMHNWNLLTGDLTFPLMILKESALAHNLQAMATWCAENNLLLAPHGKTTMCPQLYERQLALGAWAITVANIAQAQVCHHFGVPRIVIANQVVGAGNLRSLAKMLTDGSATEFTCLVDSVEGVQQLAHGLVTFGAERIINVFIEIGRTGWRTGIRSPEALRAVCEEVQRHPQLKLYGIEAFEGSGANAAEVDAFAVAFKHSAQYLLTQWRGDEAPIVSIGGTAFLDRVLMIAKDLQPTFRVLVRSGCYVTHDHARYQVQHQQSIERVRGIAKLPEFIPALELWSYVQSRPEPNQAFLTFGKRDAPFDLDMPIPLFALSEGQPLSSARLLTGARVTKLNDQHAYLQISDADELQVGDLVCCGISHPCTAFDKWRVLPVVDDDYNVLDLYQTYF
jgi:D-serine dehydratase